MIRWAFRLLTGHHLDGAPRSNAGWFRPGDDSPGLAQPGRWSRQPRAHRAFYRLVGLVALGAGVAAPLVDSTSAQHSAVLVFWLLVLLATYGFYRWCGKHGHYSDKYVSMHRKIHALVGWKRHLHPRAWITIPRDYAENPDAVSTLVMPDELRLTEGLRRKIESNVSDVLGTSPSFSWSSGERPMILSARAKPAPPAMVSYAEMLDAMRGREPGTIVLGKGDGAEPYVIRPEGESPHVALSAQTGKGKSATASTMSMQVLAEGANALVLDIKLVSIPWARTLDCVRYCARVAEIHNALVWLGEEIDRRFEAMERTVTIEGDVDRKAVGAPLWVYLEEVNSLIPELVDYYRSIREKGDPNVSPAITAIRRCMFMGRGADVHLVGIAQYLTAAAIGGPAARQNFATRILLGPDDRVWNLLVGREFKIKGRWPETLTHPGAAWVLNNGRLERCQVTYVTPREAHAFVSEGTMTPFPASFDRAVLLGSRVAVPVPQSHENVVTWDFGWDTSRDIDVVDVLTSERVTLAEWCRGEGSISFDAAKQRRTRARRDEDHTYPIARGTRGNEELYDPADLAAWYGVDVKVGT